MKRLSLVLVFTVALNLLPCTVVKADEINDAKDKSNNIQQQIDSNKDKINELEEEKKSLMSQAAELDKSINTITNEVNNLEYQISKATENIAVLEQQHAQLEADMQANSELVKKRLRTLYINQGGESYLDIIFNSTSIADFLDRFEVVSRIMGFDNKVITQFKTQKEALVQNQTAMASEKKSLETNKAAADEKLNTLNAKKEEKSNLIAKAQTDIAAHEQMVKESEAEFNQIVALINQLEEQQKQQQLQQQQQQHQQQQQQNQNQNNAGSSGGSSSSGGGQVSQGGLHSITGGVRFPITEYFGWRTSPITGKSEYHRGLDIGASMGSPVHALKSGTVAYSGEMTGYGYVVVINHGDMSTLYAHNSQLLVSVGQTVQGGQVISKVGSTGWSTGPHIHFEVIIGGQNVDPSPYYF